MTKKRPSRKQNVRPDASVAKEAEQIKVHTLDILRAYHGERRSLIPILQDIQAKFGYLPREAIKQVAKSMRIRELEVFGVASFYNQFRLNPPGKHPVKVCMGTTCHIKGGRSILEAWKRRLGIKVGETTTDHEFSLERVACIGCCAMAPVCVVDERVEGKVSPTRVDGILLSFGLEKEKGTDK